MLWKQWWLMLFLYETNGVLFCYNCSGTSQEWNQCAGLFAPGLESFNSSKVNLINCTGENAMCFVRSWVLRSRHAWIVQRGCYVPTAEDTLPRSMNTPTRAMSCKHERYPDAEYKVCLCQANWCNSAYRSIPSVMQYITYLSIYIIHTLYYI